MISAVHTEGLTKYYGTTEVVSDLNLRVEQGTMFGFLGPNGAGKSTTVGMLATLVRPTAGHGAVAGADIVAAPFDVRRRIGVVFQETTLDEDLNCVENLRFQASLVNIAKRRRASRIDECLSVVGLQEWADTRVSLLSGGMRRRLEVARGILAEPRVLFLDEPTTGLDPQTRSSVWSYLQSLVQQEGVTVFLTTHHLEEADVCDRIAILDHGELVVEGSPQELKSTVAADRVVVRADDNQGFAVWLGERWGDCVVRSDTVVLHTKEPTDVLTDIFRAAPFRFREVSVVRPTLEDVFLAHTGTAIRDREVDLVTTDMLGGVK